MSPRALGIGVAVLTTALWMVGAIPPLHALQLSSLDLRWYFFPQYETFYGALRAGTPILWNSYQLCGVPWLGTLQAGFFYPFHVLYLLLPTQWALAASTALHVALAAGTAAAFARRAGLSVEAATLAGTVFATTGAMRHWQLWPYLLEACAWLPLGAIGILDLTEDRRPRGALLLALATAASCLAGGPQGTVFAGYAWVGLLVVRLLFGAAAINRPRAVAATAAALLAGGLVGAIGLLPAYEMAQEGVRSTGTLSSAFLYTMGIPRAVDVAKGWLATEPTVLLPAVALAPLALAAGAGWLTAWGVGVGGLALLLSLGPGTPVFPLYNVLPVLGWFREPGRLVVISGFLVGVLAGLGLDTLTRLLRIRSTGFVIVAAILAALTYRGLRTPPPVPPLPYRESAVPWTATQYDAYARLAQTTGRDDRVWPFNPTVFAGSLPPKLPSVARLRSIEDYEPLTLRRHAQFFVYFLEGSTVYSQLAKSFEGRMSALIAPKGREPPATRRRLLDLTATRFLLVPPPARNRGDLAAFVRDAGFEARPAPAPDLELFENPHALPRAYVTYRARRAPSSRELLPLLARESFDPLVESWIEADADLESTADAPPRGAPATVVRDDPQVVEVQATLAAPGLVVLADTYARGWRARLDGAPAPILATNHLFRGVPAPAGAHVVRFEYRPRSLEIGAALTLAGALALILLAWRVKW